VRHPRQFRYLIEDAPRLAALGGSRSTSSPSPDQAEARISWLMASSSPPMPRCARRGDESRLQQLLEWLTRISTA
jgi:hypothetical protein